MSQNIVIVLYATGSRPYSLHVVTIYSISGLVAEYIVAIDVTRVRSPADAFVVQTPHTPTTL